MTVIGKPRSYHKKFKFIVEIDGFASAAFQKAGPLEAETAKVEYFEGGAEFADKSPGRTTFTDVVCERGAANDDDMWNWYQQVLDASANAGLVDIDYKRNVDIVQLNRDGSELRRWTLQQAWPAKFNAGDWDNDADENTIESMTLTYQFFER
jgi:phage tail-like protein